MNKNIATCTDFLTALQTHNAYLAPAASQQEIILANTTLQQMRAAILPGFLIEIYAQCGGIIMDSGYIFGPHPIHRGIKYPVPNIQTINSELSAITQLRGKTIFGRNDLFWLGFDSFGTCYMLNNMNTSVMRKYDNPWAGMYDCLMAGKF